MRSRSSAQNRACALTAAAILVIVPCAASGADEAEEPEEADGSATPEGESTDFADFSLEDLLGMETTVASLRPQTTREAPGIVTVVTEEEIRAIGARDLLDVLQLVPGFAFGIDVQSVVGVGFRGHWGHEGKVLLLLDGIEMNENLFGTLQFGNHYPVDNISRIEVIRGPGSVLYGGYAELAVINIITKKGGELMGASHRVSYGHFLDNDGAAGLARWSLGLSHGYLEPESGAEYSVHMHAGQGHMGARNFTDFWGASMPLGGGDASRDPFNLVLGIRYRDLSVSGVIDHFRTMQRDGYDEILPTAIPNDFKTYGLGISYQWKVAPRFTITPRFSYKYQEPWNCTGADAYELGWFYDKVTHRLRGGLTLSWDVVDWLNLTVGGEYVNDQARIYGSDEEKEIAVLFEDGEDSAVFHTGSVFAQGTVETVAGDFTLGARYENDNTYGGAFVPRGAYTKAFDKFHVKLLASQAFRAPSAENAGLSSNYAGTDVDLEPEKTSVFELEGGYLFTRNLFLVANVFYNLIDGPILYFYDVEVGLEGYTNTGKVRTWGTAVEMKLKYATWFATLGYSFQRPHMMVDAYAAPGHDETMLAFPAHKLTLASSVLIRDHFRISPSLIFNGPKPAFDAVDAAGEESVVHEQPAVVLINLQLAYEGLFTEGLTLAIGVHNILDQRFVFAQPYDGWHRPMPGLGRELHASLAYELPF